jgi:heptosyltransferase-2
MKKILFLTLSNIGDVILTLPILDFLRAEYADAKITVMVGPRPRQIFEGNPYIDKVIVYDKHARFKDQIRLFRQLKKEKFDIVLDLRNSLFGALLPAREKGMAAAFIPRRLKHMKDRHMFRNRALLKKEPLGRQETTLFINPKDRARLKELLIQRGIAGDDTVVVISAGARSHIKRWPKEKFLELISRLIEETRCKVILVGDKDDINTAKYIVENCRHPIVDFTGKTTIPELAYLLERANLVITNDSAVLHLASYLNSNIVAIFGPTNEAKYGPWSDNWAVVRKEIFCRPCQKAQCRFGTLECMSLIKVEDVLRAARNLLARGCELQATSHEVFKRILIVRTDRIGDVLLSTPVIKAMRQACPSAYIAMMVSPYTKEIVDGNPYLDSVITYDKDNMHKSWQRTLRFAHNLKKRKFDLALVLHPTNRVHLVTFLAGIPKRIGYGRKLGFLLTEMIKHTKHLGQKHEVEYNLDLVRHLGIEPQDRSLFMPIKPAAEEWAVQAFKQEGIKEGDKLLAIHPGASCPSKIWPNERFAEVADKLVEKCGFKVLLISGPKDAGLAHKVIKNMRHPAVDFSGRTSVAQLASLLKRCRLFISNDSGPVHIATAVGTPVISIFGRNQPGLSPKRWGPVGENDKALHKDAGCIECLAHNCIRGFLCLKEISAADVLNMVDLVLKL